MDPEFRLGMLLDSKTSQQLIALADMKGTTPYHMLQNIIDVCYVHRSLFKETIDGR